MAACAIWGTAAQVTPEGRKDSELIVSRRGGGQYIITGSAKPAVSHFSNEQRVFLTDYVVEQNRYGVTPTITTANLSELIARTAFTPDQRANNLLRYLRKAGPLGHVAKISIPDKAEETAQTAEDLLAHTSSVSVTEVITLVEYCHEQGWLTHKMTQKPSGRVLHEMMLRPPGYRHLDEVDGHSRQTEQCFVAMWFDTSMDTVATNGFEAAAKDAGYRPVRIDRKEHIEKIDDEIISEIRRSRFVIADFTAEPEKPRGGVYYEAGFARGLGIPIISTCREDRIEFVHFDTRQFNHLLWKDAADLREKLKTRISAVIGDGPLKANR